MRFKLPGSRVHVRLFERVETSNDTYDIFDVGVDFADGDKIQKIDSIAVGGSFSYAKSLIKKANDEKAAKQEPQSTEPTLAVAPEPTPAPTAA